MHSIFFVFFKRGIIISPIDTGARLPEKLREINILDSGRRTPKNIGLHCHSPALLWYPQIIIPRSQLIRFDTLQYSIHCTHLANA